MENSKIKVFIIEPDINFWQSIKALLAESKKVEVYPKTGSQFHALNSLVCCSMNYSIDKSIIQPAQQTIAQILDEQVSEETVFIISDQLLGAANENIGGFKFYETFIEGKYNTPIILSFSDEKDRREFVKSKKQVDFPILKEKVCKKISELFIL